MFGKCLLNAALAAVSLTAVSAVSAQQYVYPAKGQSPQKQKSDEGQCHTWAVQQSKYDPTNPPQQAAAPPTTATGTTPGAGVRGAARGAVVGGIVGDAGAGAAAGAVAARGQSRRQNAAQGQAATQQDQAGMASYQKARGVCLEGRGYTVK